MDTSNAMPANQRPNIPEMTDLLELRNMLEERELEFDSWCAQARHEGIREGLRLGLREGILEGKRQGGATLLSCLLGSRFGTLPAWVYERLSKATEPDLVRWGGEMLDPKLSLEQVLGPEA